MPEAAKPCSWRSGEKEQGSFIVIRMMQKKMNPEIFVRWIGRSTSCLLAAVGLVLTTLLISGPGAAAQNVEGQIIASQYGRWKVPGYAGDTYSNFAPTACRVQGGASFFSAFTAGVPIRIVDGNPSLSETVTPTAVLSTNSACSLTIHPLNHHRVPFYLTSATAGLQEAIDANLANPQPNTIILNNDWYRLGGSAAIIASVHGSQTLGLVDVTKVPTVWYKWNGSQYAEVAPPSSTGGDTEVNDLFANNPQDAFEDLYHFYATSPTYSAQSAVNAAATRDGAVTIQPGAGNTPFSNPQGVKVIDNRTDVPATERSVKEWGAQCDATAPTGSVSQGSAILTLSSGSFTSADIGKTVAIVGTVAGVPTAFEPTITAVSGSTATLSTASPFTASSVVFTLGHDDTAAIRTAISYAGAHHTTLTIPSGYCLTGPLPSVAWLRGFGRGSIGHHNSELVGLPGQDVIDGTNGANGDWGFFTIGVDQSIDPTQPWNIVDASGNTTSQTPNYRPLAANSVYSNNPLGPGWLAGSGANGSGSIVGVGAATNGSTTLTVASAAVPTVGETILFPFASTGLFVTTVSNVSGSTVTLASSFPGATTAQEEFFAGTSAQNIQTEITASQTMPFTVTLGNSIDPSPSTESNFAPYGLIEIGNEQFKYVGYSKVSPYTITLTARAQNGTTAADHAVGAVIAPLNPFQPSYPWPVTPTINSGATTPANASYYPAFNVGNCGICTPVPNGSAYPSGGFYQARVHDISIVPWNASSTDPDAGIYLVVPPYATRFQNIDITFTNFGFVEGLPSVNNHPWIATGISGNANSYSGISIHSLAAGMAWATAFGGDTSYRDFDLYTDGGSGFNLLYSYDDQQGGPQGSLAESNANFVNIYHEPGAVVYPGTGTAGTSGPMGEWDCNQCTWTSSHIEPNGEIVLNGIRQHFVGGGLGTDWGNKDKPVLVYGSDNIFDDIAGVWAADALTNVYGQGSPIFWGPGNIAYGPRGSLGSAQQQIGYGCGKQPTLGQTNETFNTGNTTTPYVNSTGGLVCPDEFNTGASWATQPFGAWTFDATAPVSQAYVSCAVGTSGSTYCQSPFFGTPARIYIGPGQRLAAGKYIATVEVKGSLSSNTVQVQVLGGSVTDTANVPVTNGWTAYSFPVDFTTAGAGAYLNFEVHQATSADTIEIGYLDFAPVPQQLNLSPSPTGGTLTGCLMSPVDGIANSGYTCATHGYGVTLAADQGASDTTFVATSTSGMPPSGCFYIESEDECYTGITGSTLTGITRGAYGTTAASHATGTGGVSINETLASPAPSGQVSGAPIWAGSEGSGVAVFGVNNPQPSLHSGAATMDINSGGNETWFDRNGMMHQASVGATNYVGALSVGGDGATQPITHSSRVLKSDQPNSVLQPYSFSSLVGPVEITAPATYGAPHLFVQPGTGSTTYTYECTGVDSQGNTIGGTTATTAIGSASLSSPSNYVQVTCPYEPGAASTNIWRTAGGPNQGLVYTGTTQPVAFFDFGGAATGGTPPSTTSIPEACIGTACWSSGSSAPTGSCNSGSLYTNTSSSPDTLYVCKSGAWAGVM